MEEYRAPKLIGKKPLMNCRVLPDHHHYRDWLATQRYYMSFGEYVGALIDRARKDAPISLMECNGGIGYRRVLGRQKATHAEKSDTPNRHPT
jgi:hypothetical protein